MSDQQKIEAFIQLIKSQSSLFSSQEQADLWRLVPTLPNNAEEIANAIADWSHPRNQIWNALVSKILFAYHQARLCYWEARQLYSHIETQVQIFNNLPTDSVQRLDNLKKLLTNISPIAFQYARLLRDMHDHTQTIITNTKNYSRWLQKISQKSLEKYSDDNLKFLENFRDRTNQRLQQIQTDLNYLSPGQDMFQQAIAASRGLVEIDQAERDRQRLEELRQQEEREEKKRERLEKLEKERDRNFQTTAFAVASGLAVGGIVISASSQVTDKNPIHMPWSPSASSSPHPFILWVFGSIVSGLVAARIAWWLTKYWQK